MEENQMMEENEVKIMERRWQMKKGNGRDGER